MEHFQSTDLIIYRSRTQLKPNSIPSIFSISGCTETSTDFVGNKDFNDCTENEEPMHNENLEKLDEIVNDMLNISLQDNTECNNAQCTPCEEKDQLIEKYERKIEKMQQEINDLRKCYNTTRRKTYYLETVRAKMNDTISELKNQKILDQKCYEMLKVCKQRKYKILVFTIAVAMTVAMA